PPRPRGAPADARAFQLPKLAHVPSYLAAPPKLKELPPRGISHAAPSAMPPVPVSVAPAANSAPPVLASTVLIFSDELGELPVTRPESIFQGSLRRNVPESARFRVAVDSRGTVRYSFLEQSSGDAALDEQARHYLVLCRFTRGERP